MNQKEIQLKETRDVLRATQSTLNVADLDALGARHAKQGVGKLYVVYGYNHAGKAADHVADMALRGYVARLLAQGVKDADIVAKAIPLDVQEPVLVAAHDVLKAERPEGCANTPGLDAPVVEREHWDEYGIGCGVKSLVAAQIANPKDLEGKAGLPGENDGERAANIVEQYRKGGPAQFVPTYVLSSLGSGG